MEPELKPPELETSMDEVVVAPLKPQRPLR